MVFKPKLKERFCLTDMLPDLKQVPLRNVRKGKCTSNRTRECWGSDVTGNDHKHELIMQKPIFKTAPSWQTCDVGNFIYPGNKFIMNLWFGLDTICSIFFWNIICFSAVSHRFRKWRQGEWLSRRMEEYSVLRFLQWFHYLSYGDCSGICNWLPSSQLICGFLNLT